MTISKTTLARRTQPEAFLRDKYHKMKRRSRGDCNRPHLYRGIEVLPFEDFKNWSLTDEKFQRLWFNWHLCKFDIRANPSVDRKESDRGYTLDNIQWVTNSENCTSGATSEKRKAMKPLLAAKLDSIDQVKFPVYVTPKLDGIRCLVVNGKAVTRKLKPIPNDYIRNQLETVFANFNVDGELMVPGKDFNGVQGDVMRITGEPEYQFVVFDMVDPDKPYSERQNLLSRLPIEHKLLGVQVTDKDALTYLEEAYVAAGYEGIMLRSPEGRYKYGRSTVREGILTKLKRFNDSEAIIVGFEEQMHNGNEAKTDALGRTERSTVKANMHGMDTLGSLLVFDKKLNIEFSVGTGFDDKLRQHIWNFREKYIGEQVTYTYQELSKYGVPRFPVYKGFRSELDA